jgi:aquaporin NIP
MDRLGAAVSHARPNIARRAAAEGLAAFALVFAGCGAIMVDAKTGALGHVGVALSFGLVIMVMVYALGHVSGAHLNRHLPWMRVFGYWGGQLLDALAAAAVLRASLRNIAHVGAG